MDTSTLKARLVKSYFSFSIGVWINAVISFITVPISSWLIDPTEFGKATMFSTIYSMLSMIALLGIPSGLMRLYHQVEEREKLLWSSLIIPLNLSVVTAVFVLFFKGQVNQFLVGESESSAYIVLILMLFLGVIQAFNQTVIRMQGKGLIYSTLQVLSSISNVGFVIPYAIFVQRNFYALLYAQLFSTAVTLALGIYFQREHWFPVKIDKDLVKEIFLFSYPFLVIWILLWLLGWTDRVVLRMYSSFTEIGLYSAAFKLIAVMNLFASGFQTFWQPFAYEQHEKNPDSKSVFRKVFDYITFVMFALALALLAAKNLVFLLFAKSYRDAAYIAPFLLLYPVATIMNSVAARGIDFAKKTYWFMVSRSIAVAFNFIGNILLVPILGAKGAALTTGLSYVIVFAIEGAIAERLYRVGYKFGRAYMMFVVYFITAATNTFVQSIVPGILSASVGLLILYLVYKDTFFETLKLVGEIFAAIASKVRG